MKKTMKMKNVFVLLFIAVMGLSLVACGSSNVVEDSTEKSKARIALVSDTIGTEQFILQAYNQLMDMSSEYGFEAVSIECSDTASWSEKSRAACVEGFDLLIGVGWAAAEPFSELAEEFSDVDFVVVDTIASNEKIKSYAFDTVQGSYIMGAMVAAAFPEEKLFGYIGNFQNQSNFEYRYGFMEGVKSVNGDAEFMVNYTDSYSDTSVAYNLAMQQAAAGCKFIMGSVASSANQGIYQAALELANSKTPIYTSGLSVDQTTSENPYIVTGLTKNTGICVKDAVDEYLAGNFAPGANYVGFVDDAFCVVGISFDAAYRNADIITDSALEAGKAAAEALRQGTITVEAPLEAEYSAN